MSPTWCSWPDFSGEVISSKTIVKSSSPVMMISELFHSRQKGSGSQSAGHGAQRFTSVVGHPHGDSAGIAEEESEA